MHDANIMGYDEMKRIVGGDITTTTRTNCSMSCPDGEKATITNCNGDCATHSSEYYVECIGSSGDKTARTYCPGFGPGHIE